MEPEHYARPDHRFNARPTPNRKPEHAVEETTRYETLEGALACLIEDFRLSGIRANPDHPSLFNGHQS